MRAIRLFEAHLAVRDVERSLAFYHDVVGLPVALQLPERDAAFLWVGEPGESMLGLWSLGSAPLGITSHVAFQATVEDVLGACSALRAAGVTPRSFFGDETDEPSVIGWMPAVAVYFLDPDGHQLEFLAMLDEPARPGAGIIPWRDWVSAERPRIRVEPYDGPRDALRPLFAEAEDSAAEIDAYIDAGRVFVARLGDAVVGHLQLIDADDGAPPEIKNMAVEPAQRGRGVGRALIAAAIESARTREKSTIAVATSAADIGNLRFYQRCGFRLRSVERDAFTVASGYAPGIVIDGIELRDRVWLDLDLS